MSVYVLALFESNFIAPLIAGWLNDAIGWRWTMRFGAIFAAGAFVILFFGMEETMYFRHVTEGVQPAAHSPADQNAKQMHLDEKDGNVLGSSADSNEEPVIYPYPAPRSLKSKLMPFVKVPGRPSIKQMFYMMVRPLVIIVKFPCVAWAGFIYGINLSWYQVMNGTTSPVLSAAPYEWRSAYIGCIYAGPIVGGVFGCLWSGIAADKLTIYLARRNGGIREPEQRLWPLALAGIFSAAGLITWVGVIRTPM